MSENEEQGQKTDSMQVAASTPDATLDAMIAFAEASQAEASEPAIIVDTFGTMTDSDAEDLNKVFFENAKELGISDEQLAKWKGMYSNNKKDPKFLRESSEKKTEMIKRGIYKVAFFEDSMNFLLEAAARGIKVITASKGGIELITALYETKLPEQVNIRGNTYTAYGDLVEILSTSSESFPFQDKTDPRAYITLAIQQYMKGRQVLGYVSDDLKEVGAAYKASEMLSKMKNPQLNHGLISVHVQQEAHRRGDNTCAYNEGIYAVGNLYNALQASTPLEAFVYRR